MRLDAAEVKVNVASDDISRAITQLGLDDKSSMQLWFFEDQSPGIPALPLFHAGIVLRVRVRASGKTESTVKLRPCRLSQLTSDWSTEFTDGALSYTVEVDRSRTSRVAAASCTVDHGEPDPRSTDGPPYAIDDLLTDRQRDFLRSCGAVRVNARALEPLGPIEAIRWKRGGGDTLADLDPRAEMWTVGGSRYLEISVRTDLNSASAAANRLSQLLADEHLSEDSSQESKTSRVLMALRGSTTADGSQPRTRSP